MCQQLDELRQSISEYASGFVAQALTVEQAGEIVRSCARMEASIVSVKTLAAARHAEGSSWKDEGHRSAAHQLAQQAGVRPSSAKRLLETGRRLNNQPEVARAALSGDLSSDQVAAVTEGAEADPDKAQELIDKAHHGSLAELHEEVAHIKAAVTDREARRREIHAKRSLRRWTDLDSAFQAHLYGNPEDGAKLWRALDPIRRRLIMCRRGKESNEALDALDYDALMTLASVAIGDDCGDLCFADLVDLGLFPQAGHLAAATPGAGGPAEPVPDLFSTLEGSAVPGEGGVAPAPVRTKKLAGSPVRIMVRVDIDVLLRDYPLQGELCEIVGYGPVPVSVIKELAANENTFLVGLLTRAEQIIGVYHQRRHPNAHQKSALDFLYPTCAARGCTAKVGLQSDHRADWAKTHYTVFDLLDRLCTHHHNLKTRSNWALVPGTGKRPFVPPTDPRHPDHPKHPTQKAGP